VPHIDKRELKQTMDNYIFLHSLIRELHRGIYYKRSSGTQGKGKNIQPHLPDQAAK